MLASEQEIINELGVRLTALLKQRGPGRISGMVTAKGRNAEWEKAFEHISTHFRREKGKATHTQFCRKFRDQDKLKELIRDAAAAPSSSVLSRCTDLWARPLGSPCLLILRKFSEPIGEDADQNWLLIVVDWQGKLVTAYPGSEAKFRERGFLG